MSEDFKEVDLDERHEARPDIALEEVTLAQAQDIVKEWVDALGGSIRDDYQRYELAWIRPNTWNPNKQDEFMFAHQLEVMRQAGQVAPIIVREVGPDMAEGLGRLPEEHYQIVDGEHRWRAAGDLGWSEISVNNLGVVPDSVAQMITVIMNHVRGDSDPLELGRLFKTLRDEAAGDKDKLQRITNLMPFRDRDIDVLVDAVRKDKRTATLPGKLRQQRDWVSFRFKVPKEAAHICTRALESVIAVGQCTTDRAFELLCADYLAGSQVQLEDAEGEMKPVATVATEGDEDDSTEG